MSFPAEERDGGAALRSTRSHQFGFSFNCGSSDSVSWGLYWLSRVQYGLAELILAQWEPRPCHPLFITLRIDSYTLSVVMHLHWYCKSLETMGPTQSSAALRSSCRQFMPSRVTSRTEHIECLALQYHQLQISAFALGLRGELLSLGFASAVAVA